MKKWVGRRATARSAAGEVWPAGELVRMRAERKVADAIILERASNVLQRRASHRWQHRLVSRFLLAVAWKLRNEAEREWHQRRGRV